MPVAGVCERVGLLWGGLVEIGLRQQAKKKK